MEWTRSPLMRAIALAASLTLVVTHQDDRDPWFWVGVGLTVLNVVGFVRARSSGPLPADDHPADGQPEDGHPEDGRSHRLAELVSVPGVAAAFAEGPPVWQQVSYLDDPLGPAPVEELMEFVWVENHDGWEIGLGDELKPYLDLDLDETDDPVIEVLRAHPGVEDAYHEDREVYRIEERRPLGTEEVAELCARALVAHHVHALGRRS